MSDHALGFDGDWPVDENDLAHGIGECVKDDNRPPRIYLDDETLEAARGWAVSYGLHEYVHVPEGSTVVVLSDFDMKIVLPGLIAQLERKIPKPRSERSSWASIASIGVLPFLRRLANGGTDE